MKLKTEPPSYGKSMLLFRKNVQKCHILDYDKEELFLIKFILCVFPIP